MQDTASDDEDPPDPDQVLRDFDDWVNGLQSGWEQIHKLFAEAKSSRPDGSAGLRKKEWAKALMKKGFKHEEWLNIVFEEILTEPGSKLRPQVECNDGPVEEEIYLPQVIRAEKRIQYLRCSLGADEDQSPTAEFVKLLTKRCGSTLRAWHILLDQRGAGRIAYSDFTTACRKLGIAQQAKHIWNNAKMEAGLTLEISELDPIEGQNLESFAERLWSGFGLDLVKAWQFFDVHHLKRVDLATFERSAQKLNFEGDAKLLFRGLDSAGLGKVKEADFMYIGKASRLAQKKLGAEGKTSQAIADFISWSQRELGGPHELIIKLGLGTDTQLGLEVMQLAARITALGFDGDATLVAVEAARADGGTFVAASSLFSLLSTGRYRPPAKAIPPPKQPPAALRAKPGVGPKRVLHKAAWNTATDNISDQNKVKCKYTRDYFQPPGRRAVAASGCGSNASQTQTMCLSPRTVVGFRHETALPNGKPVWCDSPGRNQESNEAASPHARQYFSDPADRPVRDVQRARVAVAIGGRQHQYW